MRIIKIIISMALATSILLSSAVSAAPTGIISIYYYKTAAKQELVGYWYQSCYLGFNTFWGTREGVKVYDPAMHGLDCTQLGMAGNNRGHCLTNLLEGEWVEGEVWFSELQQWVSYKYVREATVINSMSTCESENTFGL